MSEDLKARVRNQFSGNTQDYLESPLFSQGDDLAQLVHAANLTGCEHVLDVACGAGHTTIAMARQSATCIGIDLTDSMVTVARQYAKEVGVGNVQFCVGDAENLAWPDETFDVVTCRYAVHHFAAPQRFIAEAARVLKPGGRLVISDHYAAEDSELDAYVNNLNRMRDPSHVREPRLSEYQAWFTGVGLSYTKVLNWDLYLDFTDWVERSRTPLQTREELLQLLKCAPASAAERQHIQLDPVSGQPRSFSLTCALLCGEK